jgi:hypothetical protein
MKRESVVRKNLDLLDEFMKYAFDHPEILDEIPRDDTLVILPEGDPALERQNRKDLAPLKGHWREGGHYQAQSHQAQSFQGRLTYTLQLKLSACRGLLRSCA